MCSMDSPALPTDSSAYILTHTHSQTKTYGAYVHTTQHTNTQHAPSLHNPVPLENSDLTELEVRSALRVILYLRLSGAF